VKLITVILLLMLMGQSALATSTPSVDTYNRLRMVDGALEQYKLENQQRLPSEGEGLQAVRSYVFDDVALMDAWGRPFVYRLSATNDGYVIYSMGKDGGSESGGNDPDDINLWDAERKWQKEYQSSVVRPNLVISGLVLSLLLLVPVAARRRWKLTKKAD
jgi:type II secretory pathway pseudopilin PulG